MQKQDLQRIFQPFVQLGSSDSRTGTGLGLCITRQFVKLMGGEIGVESELDRGTRVWLSIPVRKESKGEMQAVAVPMGRVIGLEPGQDSKRIMIVEDQPENRLLLKSILEPLGLDIREALNGADAVKLFAEWHPHLIWMDRRMPIMDGLEAAGRIRSMDGGDKTIIVALTASVLEGQKREVLQAGLDGFVRKPCKTGEIYECMRQYLGLRYLYAEEGTKKVARPQVGVLTNRIAGLPQEVLEELRTVALTLDVADARELIGRIEAQDGILASGLPQLVNEFDFKTLQKLCRVDNN